MIAADQDYDSPVAEAAADFIGGCDDWELCSFCRMDDACGRSERRSSKSRFEDENVPCKGRDPEWVKGNIDLEAVEEYIESRNTAQS